MEKVFEKKKKEKKKLFDSMLLIGIVRHSYNLYFSSANIPLYCSRLF